MAISILVVEDDDSARISLAEVLKTAHYQVTTAPNGTSAIKLLTQNRFDIVITDIRLGAVSGLDVLRAAREQQQPPLVILLTGFGSLDTSIAALRGGAYDYLLKPCPPDDLLACIAGASERVSSEKQHIAAIESIARGLTQLQQGYDRIADASVHTNSDESEQILEVGLLKIDGARYTASLNNQPLHLTPIEYALLQCLAEAQGRVLSYVAIVHCTHGYTADEEEAQLLLKSHIHNLRQKIDPAYITNVRGIGYMLAASDGGNEKAELRIKN